MIKGVAVRSGRKAACFLGGLAVAAGLGLSPPALADGLGRFETEIKAKMPPDVLKYGSASPLGATGFVLRDITVTPPPDPGQPPMPISIAAISVDDLDFDSIGKEKPPEFVRIRVDGIGIPNSIPGVDLAKLGSGPMLVDATLDYRLDNGREMFVLNKFELQVRGLARIELGGTIDGVSAADVANPDAAMSKASLRTATLVYDDQSLLAKVMPILAEEQKLQPQALAAGFVVVIEGLKKDADPGTQKALDVLSAFAGDWQHPKGPLRISVTPPAKATVAGLAGVNPMTLPGALGVSVSYANLSATAQPTASVATGAGQGLETLCQADKRVFVMNDGAWASATARELSNSKQRCVVRLDSSSGTDSAVDGNQVMAWSIDGPGSAITACATGAKVLTLYKGSWYPSQIKDGSEAGKCRVHYEGYEDDQDETVAVARIRSLTK